MTKQTTQGRDSIESLDPNKDGASLDLVAKNRERMQELFPQAFVEGKLNFEVLRALLGDEVEESQERYGLGWHGKGQGRKISQTPSRATLRPCPEESVDWEKTKHLLIEGDNLEVLKLLQRSYHRRVKMIYIDPPYNTGNEFVYSDNYQDSLATYLRYTGQADTPRAKRSTHSGCAGRYHTRWLNMMYPRLLLSRELLRHDGAIFVSIDDHELHNLRHLMDEVFGPENFVATVIWQKMYAPKSSAKHFSQDHDYILVYAKNAQAWRPNLLARTKQQDEAYKNPDKDPRGPWRPNNLAARNYYSKGTYAIRCPGGRLIQGPPSGSYWRVSQERFEALDADGRIWWGQEGNNVPAPKIFLSEVKQGRVPQTLWTYNDVGHNQEAKKELLKRITFESSASVFDTPKPTRLIERILQIGTNNDSEDIVLDFFAGSGSTGDAAYQQNVKDRGNRRFVLVQLPEPIGADDYATIADITKARLRAAGQTIHDQHPELQADRPLDLGFRVMKLASGNIVAWDPDPDALERSLRDSVDPIRSDRSDDDLLFELLLKHGLDLSARVEHRTTNNDRFYIIDDGALVVCLAKRIVLKLVESIAALKVERKPPVMRVVFRDAGFADDATKISALQILKQAGIDDVKGL